MQMILNFNYLQRTHENEHTEVDHSPLRSFPIEV
jgi:hypothetical protein